MRYKDKYDAVVVGAGPNGLSAAVHLARSGLKVKVFEAKNTVGGGTRTEEITLPGFKHDVCSTVHPLAFDSHFFKSLPLEKYGLEWLFPEYAAAHPFEDGTSLFLSRSIEETAEGLGLDSVSYLNLMKPLITSWEKNKGTFLGPLSLPPDPISAAAFGYYAVQPITSIIKKNFALEKTRALFAGLAAHSMLDLEEIFTSAAALVLAVLAHTTGWPFPKGGAVKISEALSSYLYSLGGEIETGAEVKNINELPSSAMVFFDVTPRQMIEIAGSRFPEYYNRNLLDYEYGAGVYKVDWALSSPIPWTSLNCRKAGTVHLGSTTDDIIISEKLIWRNQVSRKPFLIVTQPSVFDDTRVAGKGHTAWAYCHVPNGYPADLTELIENRVEDFAPGFKQIILKRFTMGPAELEKYNPNYIGGDINGGKQNWKQFFSRPTLSASPYSTPQKGIYICSSSTPPGGGVHGMCGYNAAVKALKDYKYI